jgi:hypothetical protein
VNGAVISWSIIQGKGGPFKLRVVQPNPDGTYTAVGTSAPFSPATTGLETATTSLPIKTGQIIGLDNSNPTDEIGLREIAGASYSYALPALAEGVATPAKTGGSQLGIGFNALVLPTPTVTTLSKKSGSIKGGTKVTIAGTDLSRATAVSFGTVPAKSLAIESETQLTAVAPAAKKATSVTVSVTTPAGTATAAQAFLYEACKVPNLKGKKLKKAKKRLKKSACRIGKVKLLGDATKKSGEVAKQSPKPGKLLAPGSKVNVKLE